MNKKLASAWTLFGANPWSRDLPYERRLLFYKILNEYEKSGQEPPYSQIRSEVLMLTHEQLKLRLEQMKISNSVIEMNELE